MQVLPCNQAHQLPQQSAGRNAVTIKTGGRFELVYELAKSSSLIRLSFWRFFTDYLIAEDLHQRIDELHGHENREDDVAIL